MNKVIEFGKKNWKEIVLGGGLLIIGGIVLHDHYELVHNVIPSLKITANNFNVISETLTEKGVITREDFCYEGKTYPEYMK